MEVSTDPIESGDEDPDDLSSSCTTKPEYNPSEDLITRKAGLH